MFRQNLEETGMGYGLEVEMIAIASELDLLTTPYVFDAADAAAMTDAGADIIVCHMGLTTGGSIGAETARTLDDCVAAHRRVDGGGPCGAARRDRAVPRRSDRHAGRRRVRAAACRSLHGFYGASSMERLPVEQALKSQTEAFKAVRFE